MFQNMLVEDLLKNFLGAVIDQNSEILKTYVWKEYLLDMWILEKKYFKLVFEFNKASLISNHVFCHALEPIERDCQLGSNGRIKKIFIF